MAGFDPLQVSFTESNHSKIEVTECTETLKFEMVMVKSEVDISDNQSDNIKVEDKDPDILHVDNSDGTLDHLYQQAFQTEYDFKKEIKREKVIDIDDQNDDYFDEHADDNEDENPGETGKGAGARDGLGKQPRPGG